MRRFTAWLLPAGVLAAGLALCAAADLRRPDTVYKFGFLSGDEGGNLVIADDLLQGKLLYRDVWSCYGPLNMYSYAGWAWLFGNSMRSYVFFIQGLCLLVLVLLTVAIRGCASAGATALVVLVGLLPLLTLPTNIDTAGFFHPYIPLERLCLALVVLAWTPPRERTAARAAGLGAALALWQAVKFGGAAFAGGAVLLADLLALRAEGGGRRWVRTGLAAAAAFALGEAAQVGWALAALPRPIALDVLWPRQNLQMYSAYYLVYWPGPVNLYTLVGYQFSLAVGAALGLAALASAVRGAARPAGAGGPGAGPARRLRLLVPLLFYILSLTGYVYHRGHLVQYAWACVVPAALAVDRLPRRLWPALALLWSPCLAALLRADLINPINPGLRVVALPTGEHLYTSPEKAEMLDGLFAALEGLGPPAGPPGRPAPDCLLFIPMRPGLHHFYRIPHGTRHLWILPGLIRPYDEADLVRSLDRTRAVVVFDQRRVEGPFDTPCGLFDQNFRAPLFKPSGPVCQALAERLGPPVPFGPNCWLFPVRRQGR
jgi:hypothetical protein